MSEEIKVTNPNVFVVPEGIEFERYDHMFDVTVTMTLGEDDIKVLEDVIQKWYDYKERAAKAAMN